MYDAEVLQTGNGLHWNKHVLDKQVMTFCVRSAERTHHSPRERKIPGFRIPMEPGFFRGRVIQVTQKLALQWLPCPAPGVIGSALGLVGPVSVYCDWVR